MFSEIQRIKLEKSVLSFVDMHIMTQCWETIIFSNLAPFITGISLGLAFGYLARSVFSRNSSKSMIPTAMETFSEYSRAGPDDYKMVLVIRNDLKMGKGKACAQCSHASVMAYKQAKKSPNLLKKWMEGGQKKVVVKVESEDELLNVMNNARQNGLINVLVRDAGRTQIESGSKTVVGIGPATCTAIDKITGHLKLY